MVKLVPIVLLGLLGLNMIGCSGDKPSDAKDSPENMLLKDWKPRSIYKIPVTSIQKAKFPAFDMHAHDYTKSAGDVSKRAQILDEVNLEKSVVFAGTGTKFDSSYALYSKYPDKFLVFCGIDYSGFQEKDWSEKSVKELLRCIKGGAVGVGEITDKGGGLAPGMHPDDPRMDLFWETCAKLGIPVNLHISDPMWMYEPMDSSNDGLMRSWTWRIKEKDRVVDHKGLMEILANTIKRHPNTIFVAAHLANCTFDLSILGRLFDEYPNLYADISARFSEFSTIPRHTAEFFEKYQDRIVYGTDYGWEVWDKQSDYGNKTSLDSMYRMTFRVLETTDEHFYLTDLLGYKWPMYGLGLSDIVLKKIYRDNAIKVFNTKK